MDDARLTDPEGYAALFNRTIGKNNLLTDFCIPKNKQHIVIIIFISK